MYDYDYTLEEVIDNYKEMSQYGQLPFTLEEYLEDYDLLNEYLYKYYGQLYLDIVEGRRKFDINDGEI